MAPCLGRAARREDGAPDVIHRSLRAAPLAAVLLALLAAIPGGPQAIQSAFASAPGGRLVVTWKSHAPGSVAVDGVEAVRLSHANVHRSVVVAKNGRAD